MSCSLLAGLECEGITPSMPCQANNNNNNNIVNLITMFVLPLCRSEKNCFKLLSRFFLSPTFFLLQLTPLPLSIFKLFCIVSKNVPCTKLPACLTLHMCKINKNLVKFSFYNDYGVSLFLLLFLTIAGF